MYDENGQAVTINYAIGETFTDYLVDHLNSDLITITDAERAEFVAFVAHTIGLDLDNEYSTSPNLDAILDAYQRLAEG